MAPSLSRTSSRVSSSRRPSRSRSRPRNPDQASLHYIYSNHFLDDHSLYHGRQSDEELEQARTREETGHANAVNDDSHSLSEKTLAGTPIEPSSHFRGKTGDPAMQVSDAEKMEEEEEARMDSDEEVDEVIDGVACERDVEAGRLGGNLEKKSTTRSAKDPNLVTWDGPDDPKDPKNWTFKRKWAATFIVSSFTFISPVSSSMVAPALSSIASDLHITAEVESQLVLSIFVLAYAVGPIILGPLSEMYGRVPILQLSNLWFLAWNLGCGFAQSKEQLLAFRFLSGLGGSAPLAIGGGTLSDCWRAEERGKAISVYSLAPLLGPAVGPLAGGFIAENTTWRWAFWSVSAVDALIQVFGFFFLQETYTPVLLKRKATRLRKETGNEDLHTEYESPDKTFTKVMKTSLLRPFRLLFTQPIVIVLSVYMAYLYGLMYLVLSTFPGLWENRYNESIGIGGLNYISLGIGFFLGAQICAPLNDRVYRALKKRNNGVGKPEFRVPLMNIGAMLVPIGLFWYGWSAQAKVHWIVPNIGAAIIAAGTIIGFQLIQTYIVDAYTRFAASAIAAATVLRSLAGFGFPLFAPAMYNALDYGWGNSVLGFIAIAVGIPAPILLWKYGETLRGKSKFAAGGGS
ncbi:MFS multidrug transporter-like protein [Aulographum hederae CBS 113979]|uniref:MFS multidrug transporter-like protein n=1 Tax=Aulographum hederae CBS 113979 TaxID=1176131 RepID=A0A6G1HH12_9PEZI|nr:MFS multidrug transporter-like protein [Aulographum hederae CBS 113979]